MILRRWVIFTEWKMNGIPYVLDLDNEDVIDEEIEYCIQEQIYGGQNRRVKSSQ